MVNAGFNKYLIEGFKRGIPPTEAMLIKKNTMLTNVRQKPMEYMSCLLNWMMFFKFLFKKYLGSAVDPIKNAAKAIRRVTARLVDGLFKDNSKNRAKSNRTIKGLNR